MGRLLGSGALALQLALGVGILVRQQNSGVVISTRRALLMSALADPNFQIGVAVGIALSFMILGFLWIIQPWMRAFLSGAHVPLWYVLGMRLRGNPINLLVDTYTALLKAGEPTELRLIEAVYIANRSSVRTEQDLAQYVRQAKSKTSGTNQEPSSGHTRTRS